MNTIGERIAYLRQSKNMSQRALMEVLNISNLGRIEKNERMPGIEIIIAISDYFHVTTDWILKGKDSKNDVKKHQFITFIDNAADISLGEQIKLLREAHSISQDELAKLIEESKSRLIDYENNKEYPPDQTIQKICNVFNITDGPILFTNSSPLNKDSEISVSKIILPKSSADAEFLQKVSRLNRDERIKVEGIIDGILISKEISLNKKKQSYTSTSGEEAATNETA